MISRFFSSSKPIHLLLITAAALALFVVVRFPTYEDGFNLLSLLKELLIFTLVFGSIAMLSFFVSKNKLTGRNSYKILFYLLFLGLFPASLLHDEIIIANFFVLLALRRIFSLRSSLRIKKKLFDSGFWIALSVLFFFGGIFFFPLILAAIILHSISQVKNWIVPILGFITVGVLVVLYNILTGGNYSDYLLFNTPLDFDYTPYNQIGFIVGLTIFLSLGAWATFYYIKNFGEKLKAYKASHYLVILCSVLGLLLILISPVKSGAEFSFLFAPMAIIMTNYLEGVSEKWFAELFIWLLILTPFAKLLL